MLLFTSNDDRTEVLVAAADLEPGQPLERSDLRIQRVALDGGVASIDPSDAPELVGRITVGQVPAGTMLAPGMFADDAALGADEMVVGAALDPGEAPLSGMQVGAPVELLVLDVPDPGAGRHAGDPTPAAPLRADRDLDRHRHRVGRRADRHRPDLGVDAGRPAGRPHRLVGRGPGRAAGGARRSRRMTLLVVASVAGAPGATRLALGLAASWPDLDRRRVVVEADPDGGRLGAELGTGVEPGLMALALASRTSGLTG